MPYGQESPQDRQNRPLILYTYAESEEARPNFEFFLTKGLHAAADFIFILNGETSVGDLIPTGLENVKVIERENKCFDLGGMGEVLRQDDLWKQYKRFITMNASVRGPFLPMYSSDCWSDIFLNRLSNTTKLVGTSINCQPTPHVQSMLWATDDVSMGILLNPDLAHSVGAEDHWGTLSDPIGMSFCHETFFEAVHTELGSTRLIVSQGYEVDVLMTAYAPASSLADYCANGQFKDPLYDGMYYGSNIHPYETVFMKANREIDPILLEKMTEWHSSRPLDSWTTCARS